MVGMPEVKVQQIGKSLYVCMPADLIKGVPEKNFPPLDIEVGDFMVASRTKTGVLFEPVRNSGSMWVLMPEK